MDEIIHGIKELNIPSIAESQSASTLDGFFKHAFSLVRKRSKSVKMQKYFVEYNGDYNWNKLELYVLGNISGIDIYRCSIMGRTDYLHSIYPLMDGYVKLEFEGLRLGEEQNLGMEVKQNRKGANSFSKNWLFYFEGKTSVIKRAELQKTVGRIWKQRRSARLREVSIDDEEMNLIGNADRIEVNGDFFQNNRKGILLKERWTLINNKTEGYNWRYSIRSVVDRPLPAPIFFDLEGVFNLTKGSFNPNSFQNVQLRPINEEEYLNDP